MRNIVLLFAVAASAVLAPAARAEVQIVNGVKIECVDGVCRIVDDETAGKEQPAAAEKAAPAAESPRIAQGYMDAKEFIAFLRNEKSPGESRAWWAILLAAFFGGLCMNITPCVLPMIPVNLMIIGRSAARGALYGLGIAVAYGVLGLLAAFGGMAFGEIQSNPWFNAAICVLFAALAVSLSGAFAIDFSKKRNSLSSLKTKMLPGFFAFFMGMVGAVLAGACVAPVLVAVLLLTADLAAKGNGLAYALPFVLGAGMALPWPFAGAGLKALPKPGAWMSKVNKVFAVAVACFAVWYGHLAWNGFAGAKESPDGGAEKTGAIEISSPARFSLEGLKRPVLVDCWATWCKNCSAMERGTLKDPAVVEELSRFTVVKLQAEDIAALKKTPGFGAVVGLPAFLVFE